MKKLPAFACFAAAAALLVYGLLSFLDPPGFAAERVFSRELPAAIDLMERKPNPDARLVKFMPAAGSVLGEAKLVPSGKYVARVVFIDRRYDASGFRTSNAKGKARFVCASKTTGLQVKTRRVGSTARDAEKLIATAATFSVAKADTYVLYAECEDSRDVAEMATFELVHVKTPLVLAFVAGCAAVAAGLGVAGALML